MSAIIKWIFKKDFSYFRQRYLALRCHSLWVRVKKLFGLNFGVKKGSRAWFGGVSKNLKKFFFLTWKINRNSLISLNLALLVVLIKQQIKKHLRINKKICLFDSLFDMNIKFWKLKFWKFVSHFKLYLWA